MEMEDEAFALPLEGISPPELLEPGKEPGPFSTKLFREEKSL